MSEKVWFKVAKLIVRASGNPLFQANETLVELLQTLLDEEQVNFLLNFRKPNLTFQELKQKTGFNDAYLMNMLNSLMDNGILMDFPIENTNIMEYRLLSPVADTFEYSLIRFDRPIDQKKKLARIYEKMFKEATELTQTNYEGLLPIFKDKMPIFARVIPIEKELTTPQEKVLPFHEASKIIDQQDIISISECPCKLERALLGNTCKTASDRFRCLHFGNFGRYFIEHNLGKSISKDEAKRILQEAEEEGLIHKTFHDDFDFDKKENSICNCCKCCCILFQSYYRGIFAFHTLTSYITKRDESKCVSCGICAEKCPIEAISLIDGIVHDDVHKCIGCGVCVHHCPEDARSLERTEPREIYLPPPVIKE
ncbi:MAG: 4Fe-4S dicluster domain-containing protein [Candidatus Lokiarchaeota archaeon]|nr:4Fe-4S dicluster domain-containing protein [Candidatus Lokiarchaeota archaeon]